jgi:hypothetical protein
MDIRWKGGAFLFFYRKNLIHHARLLNDQTLTPANGEAAPG